MAYSTISASASAANALSLFNATASPKDNFGNLNLVIGAQPQQLSMPTLSVPKTAKAIKRRSAVYANALFGGNKPAGYAQLSE